MGNRETRNLRVCYVIVTLLKHEGIMGSVRFAFFCDLARHENRMMRRTNHLACRRTMMGHMFFSRCSKIVRARCSAVAYMYVVHLRHFGENI